ncbi:BglG family transcription antiterminator [Neobacillus cucumis]|uniref:Transcriptional antiterminator n=1 Tax=Neobacillus cucumis TaxID=1740721 RepID=A0A2N5H9Z1_9BACI|nr:BglG family transcription antiterminator [Neobacillus cucumis]PLS02341.1 transcriptional antiterminator [Neobacillus cucumis]
MNDRQKELLRILLVHKEGFLHIKDLSERLECAEKTVRNDLDRLEEYLLDYPSAGLIRKPGYGITIEMEEAERSSILGSLLSSEPKTKEERLVEIAYQLLTSREAITLQYFAERYYVAKAAIKKDIELISNWFIRYGLELVSKPRVGNIIEGTELQKRNALAHLSELHSSLSPEKNVVLDLFLPYEISIVRKALNDMQDTFSLAISDSSMDSLLVHALIMVKRTRQRSPIFVKGDAKEEACKRKEYQYTTWLFEVLESAFGLAFPEEEQVYFTWHLISSKRTEEGMDQLLEVDEEITRMIRVLMEKMGKLTSAPYESDPILNNGLTVHMQAVINRINFGFPITNPLLTNIKKMYPYMFNMVMMALHDIKRTFQMEIPEDEAAYMVLHFQASLERLGKKQARKALIVCHMGIGMSHLLEAKIEQQYREIEIIACIGKAEVKDYLKEHKIDFIISTIPLEKINIEHIVISPLFGQEEKNRLSQFVEGFKQRQDKLLEPSVFSQFLNEETFFPHVEKAHRYEVVERLANALFQKGYVSKDYIHSAVNRERSSATAIGGGIAIPHGNPSMVHTSVIAAAILKERLEWGNEKVSLVFMLAIAKEDQSKVRGIIGKIASLSETPLLVHALSAVSDYREFLKMIDY